MNLISRLGDQFEFSMVTYNLVTTREKDLFLSFVSTWCIIYEGEENLKTIRNGGDFEIFWEDKLIITISYDRYKVALKKYSDDPIPTKIFKYIKGKAM